MTKWPSADECPEELQKRSLWCRMIIVNRCQREVRRSTHEIAIYIQHTAFSTAAFDRPNYPAIVSFCLCELVNVDLASLLSSNVRSAFWI